MMETSRGKRSLGLTAKDSTFDASTELPATPTGHLNSLTGMRFLAAMLVVVHHLVRNSFGLDTALVTIPGVGTLSGIGYSGVTFFFCLSGFVLAWAWESGSGTLPFLGRRMARVYPLQFVTWVATFAVIAYLGQRINWGQADASVVLAQSWSTSVNFPFGHNAVAWSLSCELFFYAMFPFIIRRMEHFGERALIGVIAGSVLLLALIPIGAYVIAGNKYWVQVAYYFPPYRFGEFVVGVAAALLIRRGWRPSWNLTFGSLAVVGTLIAVAFVDSRVGANAGTRGLPRSMVDLAVLPAFAIWIAAAAVSDIDGKSGALARPTLVKLGTWSFALYLTHQLLLRVFARVFANADADMYSRGTAVNIAVAVVVLAILVAVSAVAYRLIEHPSNRKLRNVLSRDRRASSPS
jgi:peptidoglycan/LPS O-acetylase OafA/YrhL